MKSTVPVVITAVIGIVMILDFFLPVQSVNNMASLLQSWGIVISAFAMGLGAVNLLRRHTGIIAKGEKSMLYSLLLVGSMILTIIVGLFFGTGSKLYDFLFTNILSAASRTLYASIAFYILSAAYRAFVAKNLDGWILLLTGVVIMLGTAPIGAVISKFFPAASQWIQDIPNTAGMRAIMMGAALGVVSSAVKTFLGYDKSYLGQGE
ncbi:MAG TPA: hypothetical protein GXX23_02895 [Firmicutes bacterium]|nr:hypothetical protein [Candidatus Fermentithermobacillaceae bacterium]